MSDPGRQIELQSEVLALHFLRLVGYVNLVGLTFSIWGMKTGPGSPLGALIAVLSVIVCVLGWLIYAVFWNRLFRQVSRPQGRPFMRPYIIGMATLAAGVMLVVGLGLASLPH
jgi:hypothetical protein